MRRPRVVARLAPPSSLVDAWLDEQPAIRGGMLTAELARALLALGFRAGWRRGVCHAEGNTYPEGLAAQAEGEGPRCPNTTPTPRS